jgi:hypothetical protein
VWWIEERVLLQRHYYQQEKEQIIKKTKVFSIKIVQMNEDLSIKVKEGTITMGKNAKIATLKFAVIDFFT